MVRLFGLGIFELHSKMTNQISLALPFLAWAPLIKKNCGLYRKLPGEELASMCGGGESSYVREEELDPKSCCLAPKQMRATLCSNFGRVQRVLSTESIKNV